MVTMKRSTLFFFLGLFLFQLLDNSLMAAGGSVDLSDALRNLIEPLDGYGDESQMSIWQIIQNRAAVRPFHLITLAIFICAIIHTLCANHIQVLAHKYEHKRKREVPLKDWSSVRSILPEDLVKSHSVRVEVLHFLGEVEVIFGLWVIPLLLSIVMWTDFNTALDYIDSRNFGEPLFVITIMVLASTRPIIRFAENWLASIAKLGDSTPAAWWLTILMVGPLLGSFITEPAAMTISALLLSRQFFTFKPSLKLRYATLGLLFVNISVGGVCTHFAAPPVLMVAGPWDWDTPFMMMTFGWKAIVGIFINTTLCYFLFNQEFTELRHRKERVAATESLLHKKEPVPIWITLTHLALLGWTVLHAHHPNLMLGGFFLFLGFYQATAGHQSDFSLRPALLVGFFLASLVTHGGLQGWWLQPILQNLTEGVLMVSAIILTAFNDNAAVTYLTTLAPNFSDTMKYAVVAGAVTGGGLTVIANAPNPAGQSLLHTHFEDGISPLNLFAAAITPTVVLALIFFFL